MFVRNDSLMNGRPDNVRSVRQGTDALRNNTANVADCSSSGQAANYGDTADSVGSGHIRIAGERGKIPARSSVFPK
ncbi:hypothetical protein OZX74_00075 [Bifidobacterium sp. ESL0798]|uniref:hypothetical protein n=1 Tax=Bifidobacterium sp. ESL0798 TaxID=2983235 RepID=UPI0023F80C0A|nr:hypothetical protein [Bifidobacterium sp. ESL0798]WEV74019.1 hypothetical protein OZX74_00075 [Bifidobacterium sp. ESL0798]